MSRAFRFRLGASGAIRLSGALAFGLLAVLFGALLFRAETARSTGTEIVLETRPIDPRDTFFGHYAVLRYTIENTDVAPLADQGLKDLIGRGEADMPASLWLALAPAAEGPFHRPVLASANEAAARKAGIPLKVRVKERRRILCAAGETDCKQRLSIETGLPDRYYADPQTALALEDRMRARDRRAQEAARAEDCALLTEEADAQEDVRPLPPFCAERPEVPPAPPGDDEAFGVILSVGKDGSAVIKGLRLGGQAVYDRLLGDRLVLQRAGD